MVPAAALRVIWTDSMGFLSLADQRNQEAAASEAADSWLWVFTEGQLPAYLLLGFPLGRNLYPSQCCGCVAYI